MTADFANKLSDLRRAKGVSQKEAAAALGVSQALLSHYEKGIRECGLEFVRKASEYYGVTSDWLLGLSDTRLGANEIFDAADTPEDEQLQLRTILRCFVRLSEEMSSRGETAEALLADYMSLSVYRFVAALRHADGNTADWLTLDRTAANRLSGLLLSEMTQDFPQLKEAQAEPEKTLCFQTLIEHAELLVRDETVGMLRKT
ncbi:MAG: helix-turn-helix transcriptional regulator [Clostridia bacterium]|nr:helix-turn-helix transcriptional regulator [Clostridia bacterium]